MAFLKGNLLFDRTRARVRRKPSSRRSGINPGANLDNGREELAFPAPGKPDSSSNGESDFTGHISPASSERVVPFRPTTRKSGGERSRPAMQIKVARNGKTSRKPSYASAGPLFRALRRTQSVDLRLSVATVSQCGDPLPGGFERTKRRRIRSVSQPG